MDNDDKDIGLNLISQITDYNKDFNPNNLLCGLCYCICFEPKQCSNEKCGQFFCQKCFDKLYEMNYYDIELKCPFCRMNSGFRDANEINEIINKLKFYCDKSMFCCSQYTHSQLLNQHKHDFYDEYNINKCFVCSKLYDLKEVNFSKCNNCTNLVCFENIKSKNPNEIINTCMKKCYNCRDGECIIDLKNDSINFICNFCLSEPSNKCELCNSKTAIKVCSFCSKKLCKNCCENCKCQYVACKDNKCIISKSQSCSFCKELVEKLMKKICVHINIYNCTKCYKRCDICKINNTNDFCDNCNKRICISTCSIKCDSCNDNFCKNCTTYCSICKSIICINCGDTCVSCKKSLISCRNCKSNTIRQCSYIDNNVQCVNRLCMMCWHSCNTCHKVYCNKHCNKCNKCEEYFCDLHYYYCEKCSKETDKKYMKLCLKKCATKCIGCDNIINDFCKKENHPNDFITKQNCGHYVCLECQKKCDKCKKLISKCPICIENISYIQCIYCGKVLCDNCCGHCANCENEYCNLIHKCVNCSKERKNECSHCKINQQIKCRECGQKLKPCLNCKKLFLCDEMCYKELRKEKLSNNQHICLMYACENHQL